MEDGLVHWFFGTGYLRTRSCEGSLCDRVAILSERFLISTQHLFALARQSARSQSMGRDKCGVPMAPLMCAPAGSLLLYAHGEMYGSVTVTQGLRT
jgi:hypothetical protein